MAEEKENKDWRNDPTPPIPYPDIIKLFAAGVFIFVFVLIAREPYKADPQDQSAFDLNLTTEIIGIAVTVFIINWFNERREKQQKITELQQQLIQDVASTSNEVVKHAVHVLRKRNWLIGKNGLLQGQDLQAANLSTVNLHSANLERANLSIADLSRIILVKANLRKTSLIHSNLEKANLVRANLQDAMMLSANLAEATLSNAFMHKTNLELANMERIVMVRAKAQSANLEGAYLTKANLEGADLSDAIMRGADLSFANLKRANLSNAYLTGVEFFGTNLKEANLEGAKLSSHPKCDSTTIMPNGESWSPNVDWKQFTDPTHEYFWRSYDPESPAYSKDLSITVFSEE